MSSRGAFFYAFVDFLYFVIIVCICFGGFRGGFPSHDWVSGPIAGQRKTKASAGHSGSDRISLHI